MKIPFFTMSLPFFGDDHHHHHHHIHGNLVGGVAMLAGTIIRSKLEQEREEREQQREEARRAENWVICNGCGRKFNFTTEGGAYDAGSSTYACPACAASGVRNRWVCKACGATTEGAVCEYCGTPRQHKNNAAAPKTGAWKCPGCGRESTGNFCVRCGAKRP